MEITVPRSNWPMTYYKKFNRYSMLTLHFKIYWNIKQEFWICHLFKMLWFLPVPFQTESLIQAFHHQRLTPFRRRIKFSSNVQNISERSTKLTILLFMYLIFFFWHFHHNSFFRVFEKFEVQLWILLQNVTYTWCLRVLRYL